MLFDSSPRVWRPSPAVFLFEIRTRTAFADAAFCSCSEDSLCFPASLRNLSVETSEAYAPSPLIALTARPGRPRTEEILLVRCHVPAAMLLVSTR